jgi:hypothetical protein
VLAKRLVDIATANTYRLNGQQDILIADLRNRYLPDFHAIRFRRVVNDCRHLLTHEKENIFELTLTFSV